MNAPTIFCDIDGTLLPQGELHLPRATLPGAREKLTEWKLAGAYIVLTTARPEQFRVLTYHELHRLHVPYDVLLMGLGTGPRFLINNLLPDSSSPAAYAFNVPFNGGLEGVHINL